MAIIGSFRSNLEFKGHRDEMETPSRELEQNKILHCQQNLGVWRLNKMINCFLSFFPIRLIILANI